MNSHKKKTFSVSLSNFQSINGLVYHVYWQLGFCFRSLMSSQALSSGWWVSQSIIRSVDYHTETLVVCITQLQYRAISITVGIGTPWGYSLQTHSVMQIFSASSHIQLQDHTRPSLFFLPKGSFWWITLTLDNSFTTPTSIYLLFAILSVWIIYGQSMISHLSFIECSPASLTMLRPFSWDEPDSHCRTLLWSESAEWRINK